MNIYEKLLYVQTNLKAPKNQRNEFGKYNYRNCEDIQEAVKPLAEEVKALLVTGDELVMIGDRFYVKSTARFIDCEGEMEIKNTAYAREELDKKGMDSSQITGSTSSYARKYALNGLFCIDDVKDADSQDNTNTGKPNNAKGSTNKEQPKNSTEPQRISKKQIDELLAECDRIGKSEKAICTLYKIGKFADMDLKQYQDAMKNFKVTPDKPLPHPNPDTIPPDNAGNGLPWNDKKE